MDAARESALRKRMDAARLQHGQVKKTLAQLEELEADLGELITRLRWQMYLGYDKTSVEFLKKLDLRH